MKKAIAIVIVLLYCLPLVANNISVHYCGGLIENVSFFDFTDASCCGSKKMAKGCCKDVKISIATDNHETVASAKIDFQKSLLQAAPHIQTVQIFPVLNTQNIWANYHPPDIPGPGLHILNSVFRI